MDEMTHPLKAYRAANRLTLEGLAKRIGVRANTVWRWENGRIPDQKEWPKIKATIGIEAEELVRFKTGAAT
jgi:transcriptional regulator with XRE-family HTH domain